MSTAVPKSDSRIDSHFDPRIDTAAYPFPLTPGQREILVSATLSDEANCAFNVGRLLEVNGSFDIDAFSVAAATVLQRHGALRSKFEIDGSCFSIVSECASALQTIDLTQGSDSERNRVYYDALTRLCCDPFDLTDPPLCRIGVISRSAVETTIVVVAHHIICDGWSTRLIVDELIQCYNAQVSGEDSSLPKAECFGQFALRNEILNRSSVKKDALSFWTDQFADFESAASLPIPFGRPNLRTYSAGQSSIEIGPTIASALEEYSRQHNASPFAVMLALFMIWTHRLSGKHDIVFGVPAAGQPFFDMQSLVGHCANLLPFRGQLTESESFNELIQRFKSLIADGYSNQSITFGELLEHISVTRDSATIPLVPMTLNVVSPGQVQSFVYCETEHKSLPREHTTFEAGIDVYILESNIRVDIAYNTSLFPKHLILEWLESFKELTRSALGSPNLQIGDLNILSEMQISRISENAQNTVDDIDVSRTVIELFDRECALHPDRIATDSPTARYSYAELRDYSVRLSRFLRKHGASKGLSVGVMLERSAVVPAVLLAVLRTGASYVPIDPTLPADRVSYMLDDSETSLVISQLSLGKNLRPGPVRILLDLDDEQIQDEDVLPFDQPISASDRAYVIYTSGSTGKPKGVEVAHGNLSNFLQGMLRHPGSTSSDRYLALTNLSFDVSVVDMYLPIISGAYVYVGTSQQSTDGQIVSDLIQDKSANTMTGTPSLWRLLHASDWKVKPGFRAFCAGEPLPQELVPQLLGRGCELWNLYGPTEATVYTTGTVIDDPVAPISIGRPLANTTIYVTDSNGCALPAGVAGEMLIGGQNVAIGYLNRETLTTEQFVECAPDGGRPDRYYKTGDLAFVDVDGRIHHLGRIDSQVKVRGYRIELGEIEACLAKHPDIFQASVVVETFAGEPELSAYIKVNAGSKPTQSELRSHLSVSLPTYMVPQRYLFVDEFPLTPSGKVDRKLLRTMDIKPDAQIDDSAAAMTPTELAVGSVWKDLIGGAMPNPADNFFDIGGHSLLALRTIREIEISFGRSVTARMLMFENLRSIAEHLDKGRKTAGFWSRLTGTFKVKDQQQ